MSPENHIVVESYRKKLGQMFSAEDLNVEPVVKEILIPISWRFQAVYGEGNSAASLASLKDFLTKTGRNVKPVELTALFLKTSVHDELLAPSVSDSMCSEDKSMEFIIWHDFTHGFAHSLTTLLIAGEDEEGKNEMLQGAIEDLSLDRAKLSRKNIVELTQYWTRFETEATGLLSEDPTGTKILEVFRGIMEAEKGNPQFFGHFIPEFVIAGVDLAKDLHRVVYPQAASLYN